MKIPPQAQKDLGTGEIVVYDSAGNPVVVPDDLGTGQKTFENNYRNSQGDLAKLEQDGASLTGALNTINDPHSTISAKLEATAVIVTLTTAAITYVAAQVVLTGTLATIAAAVPVIGAIIIVCLAVLYAVVAAIGEATAGGPSQDTPEQKLALRINRIPTDLPLPSGVNPPTIGTIQAIGILSDILDAESKGQSATDSRLALAQLFGNQAGFADDVYHIAADVVLSPRWKLGPVKSLGLVSEETIRQARAQGSRAFGLTSYEEALEAFRNLEPLGVPSRFQPIPATSPSVRLSAASSTALANQPVIERAQRGRWKIPRYLPGEGKGNYDPYDVARYLVIFSVLYSLTDPRQARAATYAAVYLILLQKAWAFKAANAQVPNELYTSMGFLLDLVSQYPFVRIESSRTLNPVTREPGIIRQPVFRDIDFYVKYYLAMAPEILTEIPEGSGPQGGGAVPPPAGQAGGQSPRQPINQIPNRPAGGAQSVSGHASGASAVLYPGNYLIEVETVRHMDPRYVMQVLQQYGVTSHLLQTPPGPTSRLVAQILRPLKTASFLPGLKWRLMRKL